MARVHVTLRTKRVLTLLITTGSTPPARGDRLTLTLTLALALALALALTLQREATTRVCAKGEAALRQLTLSLSLTPALAPTN